MLLMMAGRSSRSNDPFANTRSSTVACHSCSLRIVEMSEGSRLRFTITDNFARSQRCSRRSESVSVSSLSRLTFDPFYLQLICERGGGRKAVMGKSLLAGIKSCIRKQKNPLYYLSDTVSFRAGLPLILKVLVFIKQSKLFIWSNLQARPLGQKRQQTRFCFPRFQHSVDLWYCTR